MRSPALWFLFFLCIALNVFFWSELRQARAHWKNVPSALSAQGIEAAALGDAQAGYRVSAIMLQNIGDAGGRSEPLRNYDYSHVRDWLFQLDKIDSISHFLPFLAAHYFGAVNDPYRLRDVLDYIYAAGARKGGEHWRWLVHGAFLARNKVEDLDLAMKFADRLSAVAAERADLPAWARQMPAFIMRAKGEEAEARQFMIEVLKENAENMHPAEVAFTKNYICERLNGNKDKSLNKRLCVSK